MTRYATNEILWNDVLEMTEAIGLLILVQVFIVTLKVMHRLLYIVFLLSWLIKSLVLFEMLV